MMSVMVTHKARKIVCVCVYIFNFQMFYQGSVSGVSLGSFACSLGYIFGMKDIKLK